ncbi:MAG: arsenite methyltransferase [Bacteroidetes bacterium]|nr:arsenite methyltransferase [Bacteroidota bacterium]
MSNEAIKSMVKEKYGQIALTVKTTGCCGSGESDYSCMNDDYSKLEGYNPDADLNLGCGLPTEFARISKGDTVLDLGSGAGNDCFVARSLTGPEGKVIGVDMTEPMIARAKQNAAKLGYENIEFRLGEIEAMPVADGEADVVVSNCVLNLVPEKKKAFEEMHRVLKPGGHFCVSDIVLEGNLPKAVEEAAVLYAGCVSGAQQKGDYVRGILDAGFVNVKIEKQKTIKLPDETLAPYLSPSEIHEFRSSGVGIYSITVYGEKQS